MQDTLDNGHTVWMAYTKWTGLGLISALIAVLLTVFIGWHPLLVLRNKNDIDGALTEEEFIEELKLRKCATRWSLELSLFE